MWTLGVFSLIPVVEVEGNSGTAGGSRKTGLIRENDAPTHLVRT